MSKQDIEKEIAKWEEKQMINSLMTDFYTDEDRAFDETCRQNILRLKEELEKAED